MQVLRYVFVHNMPGYLPEADPEFYTTWEDAKQAAIDYLEREADSYDQRDDDEGHDLAESCSSEAGDLNLISELADYSVQVLSQRQSWSTQIGNVHYSITPDWVDEDDLDED